MTFEGLPSERTLIAAGVWENWIANMLILQFELDKDI